MWKRTIPCSVPIKITFFHSDAFYHFFPFSTLNVSAHENISKKIMDIFQRGDI